MKTPRVCEAVSPHRLLRVLAIASGGVLSLAALSLPVQAGIGFQPPSLDELKMTSEPKAPGAPAIILFRQVDRDDNGRTSHEDHYVRIKILTEEGRKYADVEIPFLTSQAKIINIRARTIRPDGSIADFEGKAFDKEIIKARGLKVRTKTFTLPDVQVGAIIEYLYTIDFPDYLIFDSHWVLSDELFTKSASFSLKPYREFACRWTWNQLPPDTPVPKEGTDHVIRMEAKNIPGFQVEDFMPPENELKSRVDFIYSEEAFETEPDKYWRKTGKKLNGQLESFIGKHKAVEQAVGETVTPGDSPEMKARKLYARVQQFRNTSYEVEKTEQEEKRAKEKESSNVEDVWKRGYGTGMDLTWLYLGLARAAGLEAYGLWASDRRNYFFNPSAMEGRKLDANVVLLKIDGKDVYCDPGSKFAPFGLLPWSETSVPALKLDKDGGKWMQTFLPESSASRIERKADLKLSSDNGSLEGKLTVSFTGLEAMRRRVEERNVDETDRKKFLEDQVREYIPAAIEVELTNKPDWTGSESPLVGEFDLKVPGWVSGSGRRAFFPVGLFSATEKRLFDHANRVHPIYFDFPYEKVDDISVELPLGWQPAKLPPAQKQDGHVVVYTLKADADKGTLHVSRSLTVDFLLLDVKYYGALRNFFQVVRTGDEQQIVLQPI